MRAPSSFLVPLFFLTASLQAGQVIFTEVMYNPPAGKPEYIEITNLTSNRADTASWTLSDGVEWAFPAFAAASPNAHFLNEYGRFILSSADEAATRAAWPAIPPTVRIMGPWTGALNNAGDTIVLKDGAGAVQSTLTYGDGGDWPLAADGAGHSLQIINQMNSECGGHIRYGWMNGVVDKVAIKARRQLHFCHCALFPQLHTCNIAPSRAK